MQKVKKFVILTTTIALILNVNFVGNLFKLEKAQAAEPAKHLVISEIQTSGDTTPPSNDEFVEIYNPTNLDIDIGGWDIAKASKTVTSLSWDLVKTIPSILPSIIIKANSYYLIASNDYNGAVGADLKYNATLANSGFVALRNESNIIIDYVGYGDLATPSLAEGGSPANAGLDLLSNSSIERKPDASFGQGNGQDTDNNAADFSLRKVSDPQNSSSSVEIPNPPAAVTNLTAIDKPNYEGGAIILTWTKSVDDGAGDNNVTGYSIYRRTTGGSFGEPIGAVGQGIETFTDNTAILGVDYYYKIEVLDGAYSSFSDEFGPIISKDNLAPRISKLSPNEDSYVNNLRPVISVILEETGSGIDESSIELKLDGVKVTPAFNPTTKIITYSPDADLVQGMHTVELSVADNAANLNSATWRFGIDTQLPSASVLPLPSAINTKTFNISYYASDTTSGSGVDFVNLYYSYSSDNQENTWTSWFQYNGNFKLSPIIFDTTNVYGDGYYDFYLTATDKAGNTITAPTDTTDEQATTFVDTVAPSIPTGLSTNLSGGKVSLSWNPVAGADYYEIWRSASPAVLIATVPSSQTSYTDNTIERGKNYQYQIIAVDKAGNKSQAALISINIPNPITIIPKAQAAPKENIAPPQASAQEVAPPAQAEEQGKILGGETTAPETKNWTPIIVLGALILLFVAAYSGWRWYQKRSVSDRW